MFLEDLLEEAQDLIKFFEKTTFKHIPHNDNKIMDAMANLGAFLKEGESLHHTLSPKIFSVPPRVRSSLLGGVHHVMTANHLTKATAQRWLKSVFDASIRLWGSELRELQKFGKVPLNGARFQETRKSDGWDDYAAPSTYKGKTNLYLLAQEISSNMGKWLASMKASLQNIKKELSMLKEAVQATTTASNHVLHEVSHLNPQHMHCLKCHPSSPSSSPLQSKASRKKRKGEEDHGVEIESKPIPGMKR
eukprot:Gb_40514 [translate_table: standard]